MHRALIIGAKNLFILILFFLLSTRGLPASTIHLDSSTRATEIFSSIEVFEDLEGNLTLQDLISSTHNHRFAPYRINHTQKKFDSVYWIRFTVVNNNTNNENWYLTFNNNYVQSLQLFQLRATATEDSTFVAKNILRIIEALSYQNLPTFPLLLSKQQTSSFYLRVKSSLIIPQMGLTVYSPDGLLKRSNQYSAFYAFIIGTMLIIGIYNLVLFVMLRHPIYASMSISILSLVFIFSNLNGLYAQATGINMLNTPLYNAMYLLTIAGSLDFIRRVIEAGHCAPFINKLLLGIECSAVGLLIIIYWIPHADQIINFTVLFISPILLIGIVQARRNGRRFTGSLVVVVPVYLLSVLPYILAASDMLENNASYLVIMHVGILLVMVLLSFTFAERAREINESKELAQAASEAKSQFLANMSHELRTPMNAVMGFSQLLQQTSLDTEQKDYINKSLGSAKHMLGLIDTVLDFSRTEVKQLRLEPVNFKLDNLLQLVATHIEVSCKAKQIDLIVHMDIDTPEQVYADPLRLRQVLINLASNAVKFTEHGKIILSVKTIHTNNNQTLLKFSVTDTGIGIDTKRYKDLLKPFTQVNSHYSREQGGMGLGLAISQEIIELMDSKIELQSVPEEGSVFSFELWMAHGKESNRDDLSPEQKLAIPLLQWANKNILLVEDDILNQEIAQKMLKNMGVTVTIASSGEMALQLLHSTRCDLIFMDIQMPGQDGYETTELIRANPDFDHIPVIALTAHARVDDESKYIASGMKGYLTKPIYFDRLKEILIEFLPSLSQATLTGVNRQSDQEIQDNLRRVSEELGKKPTQRFLQITLKYLIESSQELQHYLNDKEWDKASFCAHRLRSSTNLYGSTQLANLLETIDERTFRHSELERLQKDLDDEYSAIIIHITQSIHSNTLADMDIKSKLIFSTEA